MRRDVTIQGPDIAIDSRRRRSIEIALVFVLAFHILQSQLAARQVASDRWTGKWVIPRHEDYELRAQDGNIVFGQGHFALFLVERIDGKRLWIHSGILAGSVDADQVVAADSAIDYFTATINNNASNWYAHAARGLVRQTARGDVDHVIADFTAAIQLRPREPNLYYFRAFGHQAKQSYDKALEDFNRAIRLVPRQGVYFYYRGMVWIAKKDYENAIADFNDAIRLGPADAQAHNTAAWLLATCPVAEHRDGKRAVKFATKACELTSWKAPHILDTLAAAHAEAGDFDSAVKWQAKAIDLLSYENQKAEYRTRLKLYQTKKAFHQQNAQ
jgi:Tfp pilus assembly protein PilF